LLVRALLGLSISSRSVLQLRTQVQVSNRRPKPPPRQWGRNRNQQLAPARLMAGSTIVSARSQYPDRSITPELIVGPPSAINISLFDKFLGRRIKLATAKGTWPTIEPDGGPTTHTPIQTPVERIAGRVVVRQSVTAGQAHRMSKTRHHDHHSKQAPAAPENTGSG